MAARRRRGLKTALLVCAASLALLVGLGALYHRPILSRAVTCLALRDGRALWPRVQAEKDFALLASPYEKYFQRQLIDREYLIDTLPLPGVNADAGAYWVVIFAYFEANQERFSGGSEELEEFRLWLKPLAKSSRAKEVLVNFLTS